MNQRISGMQASAMLATAFIFDLIPALVFVVAFALMLPGLHAVGACITNGVWSASCVIEGGTLLLGGAAIATLYALFVAPALYGILSLLMGILGILTFTGWFYFSSVPIWGFKTKRLVVNLFTFIIELFPLVSLLPGITFFVWRHIAMSRAEDRATALERQNTVGRRRAMAQAERYEGARNIAVTVAAGAATTFPQGKASRGAAPRYTRRVSLANTPQRSSTPTTFPQGKASRGAAPRYTRRVSLANTPQRSSTPTYPENSSVNTRVAHAA